MKTKMLYILIVFIFHIQIISSQCINVDLSVTWKEGYDIFKKDSIVCIPYLNIIYQNNGDIPLYLLKLSDSMAGLPILPIGSLLQYPIEEFLNPDYHKRAKSHLDYTDQDFYVRIGGSSLYYDDGWEVESDTVTVIDGVEIEKAIDFINDELSDIYTYLMRNDEYYDSKEYKIYFSESDISPDSILNKIKDRFLFLKPGEKYTDTYNLIGFKLVHGNFTFYIRTNKFTNYVNIDPIWDEKQSRFIQRTAELPKKVGEYILYSGEFKTNEITISF